MTNLATVIMEECVRMMDSVSVHLDFPVNFANEVSVFSIVKIPRLGKQAGYMFVRLIEIYVFHDRRRQIINSESLDSVTKFNKRHRSTHFDSN